MNFNTIIPSNNSVGAGLSQTANYKCRNFSKLVVWTETPDWDLTVQTSNLNLVNTIPVVTLQAMNGIDRPNLDTGHSVCVVDFGVVPIAFNDSLTITVKNGNGASKKCSVGIQYDVPGQPNVFTYQSITETQFSRSGVIQAWLSGLVASDAAAATQFNVDIKHPLGSYNVESCTMHDFNNANNEYTSTTGLVYLSPDGRGKPITANHTGTSKTWYLKSNLSSR